MPSNQKKTKRIFTLKRLRSTLEKSGAERISRAAISELDEVLRFYGTSVVQKALKNAKLHDRLELKQEDLTYAMSEGQMLEFHPSDEIYAHYLWLFRSNGTCLLSHSFSGLNFPDTLFTGLLMGITNMVQEVSGRTLDYLVLDDLVIHIKNRGEIYVCLCTETHQRKKVSVLLERILNRFFDRYSDIIDREVVNLNIFETFIDNVEEELETAGMAIPADVLKSEKPILSQDDIEDSVWVAALRKEIAKASQEIKKLPIFSDNEDKELEINKELKDLDEENRELMVESQNALKRIKESDKEKNNNNDSS